MNEGGEVKIVFMDGPTLRVIRGIITSDDNLFFYIKRSDGEIMLAKSCVLRIEKKGARYEGSADGRSM